MLMTMMTMVTKTTTMVMMMMAMMMMMTIWNLLVCSTAKRNITSGIGAFETVLCSCKKYFKNLSVGKPMMIGLILFGNELKP